MRLWPLAIIDQLPREQLLGQHRECCALRGKGRGRKHASVDYVFKHPYSWLFWYHMKVTDEMCRRGYYRDLIWTSPRWRGRQIQWDKSGFTDAPLGSGSGLPNIYPEHDKAYLDECIENLASKGIEIDKRRIA